MRLVKSEWVSQLTETGINAKLVMFNSQSKDLKGSVPWDNFSVETSFNSTVTQGWFLEILIFYSFFIFLFTTLLHLCNSLYSKKFNQLSQNRLSGWKHSAAENFFSGLLFLWEFVWNRNRCYIHPKQNW